MLCTGECSTLAADLQGAQSSGADLIQQREDLTAQAASLNEQLTDLQAAHEMVRSVLFQSSARNASELVEQTPNGSASLQHKGKQAAADAHTGGPIDQSERATKTML